jgi:hypothetical protein
MTKVGSLSSPDDWNNANKIKNLLAKRLSQRRLSVFLGAGVSTAFNLPQWGELLDRLYTIAGETRPAAKDNTRDAERLAGKPEYRGDPLKFAADVRTALYSSFSVDQLKSAENAMLSALGALVMSSVRGAAMNVVTFNYDDLLETYLRWRGFVVDSVANLPAWNGSSDVTVLHPHGWLPLDAKARLTSGIVLTQKDYDRIVGDAKNFWRQRQTDIMRSTTPVFLGLSGSDPNLTSMLTEVQNDHPSKGTDHYWGVRLTAKGDTNSSTWEERGIRSFECADFDHIPSLLMEVCRQAAESRVKAESH